MKKHTIIYGSHTLEYSLIKQKRDSLKLTIKPNMEVILLCPTEAKQEKIETFLQKKWNWIDKQIKFFEKYHKKIYKKEYVSGESFYYLGRQYQLIIKKAKEEKITLSRGKILLQTTIDKENKLYIKKMLDIWYKERAKTIFKERFELLYQKFGYKKKILLRISPMKRKWGSFKGQTITLNPLLLQSSSKTIDYVITHELCHVRYKNHNKKFWQYLEEMYLGWEKIKENLEIRFG